MPPREVYACRKGELRSAVKMTREPTAQEWAALAKIGFEQCVDGPHYRKTVACPVNGDGYWYTRCELLDTAGNVVGTREVENGPRGEI